MLWWFFHTKALYRQAYRVGDVEHINRAKNQLVSENTVVSELEFGYQFPSLLLSANIFSLSIDKPIIFAVDNTTTNAGRLGSVGFEIQGSSRGSWGFANFNYSYYQVNNASIDAYVPNSNDKAYISIPQHKLTLNSSFNYRQFRFSPSFWYIGKRYDVAGNVETIQYPVLLLNFFTHYSMSKNFTCSAGVYDILDEKFKYVQAYRGISAPIPGSSREFLVKFSYDL